MRRFLFVALVSCVAFGLMSGTAVAKDKEFESSLTESAFAQGSSASSFTAEDGTVTVFGAGRQFENIFAFFARRTADGTTTGWMFFRESGGSTWFTPVECLAVAPAPGGGGIATMIGPIEPPQGVDQSLILLVTDGNQGNGHGDELTAQTAPRPVEEAFPCAPFPGVAPIDAGNIVIQAS